MYVRVCSCICVYTCVYVSERVWLYACVYVCVGERVWLCVCVLEVSNNNNNTGVCGVWCMASCGGMTVGITCAGVLLQ